MATRGRKPTPTAIKKLTGNPGRRPLPKNEPMPRGNLHAAPSWFSAEQKEGWDYAIEHAPRAVLKRIDRGTLAAWVIAEDLHRQAVTRQNESGELVAETPNKAKVQSPYLAIINRQALIMLKAASELGFSPSARPRLATGKASEYIEPASDDRIETEQPPEQSISDYLARRPTQH